jgi:hypothetical protein
MTDMGHEEQFPPPSLSGCFRLGEATFTGIGGNEEDAPIAAISATRSTRRVSPKRYFDERKSGPSESFTWT